MRSKCRAMVVTGRRDLRCGPSICLRSKRTMACSRLNWWGLRLRPGIYEGRPIRGIRPFPIILGHEIVGRIVEMGEDAKKTARCDRRGSGSS